MQDRAIIETTLNKNFVKAINMIKEYDDKRKFPLDIFFIIR